MPVTGAILPADAGGPGSPASDLPHPPRVIAVGGGKGGVGKSFLVANLAAVLARDGFRVVAVDADLEGANLHTCLSVPAPPRSLADFVAGREPDPVKLPVETPIPGLSLIAGTHAHLELAHPEGARRTALLRGLRRIPADFLLVDLGAGNEPVFLDYFLLADEGLVVLAPEPTSVENAYAFLRAAFYRRLRLALRSHGVQELVAEAMDQRNERGIRTPLELLREVEARDSREGARFAETMRAFRPQIVVNQVRSARDVKLGYSVRSVCRRYFGVDADYLGYVSEDPAVRESLRARRPVVEIHPRSDAAIYLRRIARKLSRSAGGGPAVGGSR